MPERSGRWRWPSALALVSAVLCLGLSLIGLAGAYALLTLGLQTLSDPLVVRLLAGFGVIWAAFWLYLLATVLRSAMRDEG